MLSRNNLYPHLTQVVMMETKQFVENHLYHDWAISIEYTDSVIYMNTKWKKWGSMLYRISNASEVLDGIYSCHKNNPISVIRMHAEKYTPRTSLYYFICGPGMNHEE